MNKEEKKVIDKINNSYDYNTGWVEADASDWRIVTDLIEKQSKEIEELKEGFKIQEHNYQVAMEEIEQRWKDKIKAKIEPRLKELDEQMKKEWKEYGNSREYQDMEDEWNFLQSLLEKE